ncbi:MAG: SLBB domain-containing protein, partial [Pseudomonadota bacterium]
MRLEIEEVETRKPTLCLNMIVKNESKIIRRLMESVSPIIDCYCICDTGSTDDTIEIINTFFSQKNIPGKVVSEPFKNFAHNRSHALQVCSGMSDYALLLDADMIFEINNFDKRKLAQADSFCLLQGNDDFYYKNMRIVRNNGLYKYTGVTHEYISTPSTNHNINLGKNELFIRDIGDGGSKSDKFERDVRLLLDGLKEEPGNVRYHFYLANSYKDSGQFDKAIEYYLKRIALGDWEQEIWYSYYNIGNIYDTQGKKSDAIAYWLKAYNHNPNRLENIHKIVQHYRFIGECKTAKMFYDVAKNVLNQNIQKDNYLFLANDVYTYKFEYEYSIIGGYLGIKNINDAIVTILNNSSDSNIITNTFYNMKFYKDILKPIRVIKLDESNILDINNGKVDFKLEKEDEIIIYDQARYTDQFSITVIGEVRNPFERNFRFDENLTIEEALGIAGGLKNTALQNGYIYRTSPFDLKKTSYIQIDLNLGKNIKLVPGDKLVILNKDVFDLEATVGIIGDVKNAVNIRYDSSIHVKDLLKLAGGFT